MTIRERVESWGYNPECDGTDAAHPAYWRGHDHAVAVLCQKIAEILDGKDDGRGVASEPWEPVRRRLLALLTTRALPRSSRKRRAAMPDRRLITKAEYDEMNPLSQGFARVPTRAAVGRVATLPTWAGGPLLMAEGRCRTIKGVHIPGCMGCAVYGHERCTCPKPNERRKDAEFRIAELERRLLELEKAFYARRDDDRA